MKYISIALLLIIPIVVCAEQITLKWDPPEGDIDGIRIYRNTEGNYNYDQPMTTDAYTNGDIPPDVTAVTVDLPGRADEAVNYYFVARAFRGDRMSIDSNEVEYTVVRIPPPAPDSLSGEFIRDESVIKLTYEQPADDYQIHHWILYYKIGDAEYQVLGSVDAGQDLRLERTFDAVPPGEKATVSFVVTAYRRSGVFSQNSAELELEIDRTVVNPPQNFKIDLEIPVG